MIKVIGETVINVFNKINKNFKGVDGSFLTVPRVKEDEVIEGDYVVVYVHSGSNEGYYICIATASRYGVMKEYFIFRFHIDLDLVIEVQNQLLKILDI